jgi:hypothetical protein
MQTTKQISNAKSNAVHNPINNPINGPLRMYINGTYVSKTHPLHKPGRWVMDGGDVSTLRPDTAEDPSGFVYIITNPVFPKWVKVGKADVTRKRLKGYQTGDPMRAYEVFTDYAVAHRADAEDAAHRILKRQYTRRNEWFECTPEAADILIRGTMEEFA